MFFVGFKLDGINRAFLRTFGATDTIVSYRISYHRITSYNVCYTKLLRGRCADHCVVTPSAVKCVHAYALCGYCDLCGGYLKPDANALSTAAENQLCPTAAIKRTFVEDPYFEYEIDEELCIGCGKCVKGCTAFGNGSLHLQVRHDICVNCNECSIARVCPADAFQRVPASTPYLIKGDFTVITSYSIHYTKLYDGSQGIDLYRFELYDDVRPVPVSYVRGYVVDQQSQMPVKAEIKLIDLKNGRQAAQTWSDSKTGEFFMALPLGHEYAFNVSCPDYLFFSENFSLNEVHQAYDPAILNIPLLPIEVGSSVVLRNVFFQSDSYDLLDQSRIELDRLVYFMAQNPDVAVEIGGHTDNIGSTGYNDELSEKRALSVWQFLINASYNFV